MESGIGNVRHGSFNERTNAEPFIIGARNNAANNAPDLRQLADGLTDNTDDTPYKPVHSSIGAQPVQKQPVSRKDTAK